jgi:hypothetical protein
MSKPGYEFEKAVYAFIEALDPSAEILFNHKVRDRDTNTLRQCDVWINAKFGGHWPLSILVSCKDHARKINISDIGAFCNEVRSTGASTGVIYSKSGFTEPAITKAKANGLACCRLYQNEPPDIPKAIWFEHFTCTQSVKLALKTDLRRFEFETWNDLFDIRSDDTKTTILDIISETFVSSGDQVASEHKELFKEKHNFFPEDWAMELRFTIDGIEEEIQIQILGHWKRYRARLEANLLNGSYCLTDESFTGQQVGPYIDVKGEHPGKHWEEITEKDFSLPSNMILAVLYHPSGIKNQLREVMGPQKLYS